MKKIILLFVLSTMLILCSCHESNDPVISNSSQGTAVKPKAASKEVLKESLNTSIGLAAIVDPATDPEYLTKTEELNSFEIISFTADGELADAVVKVSAPDLYSTVKKIEAMEDKSTAEKEAMLPAELAKAQITVTELEMQFELINGEWKPVITDEFLDAYYGGIGRLRSEYFAQIEGVGEINE